MKTLIVIVAVLMAAVWSAAVTSPAVGQFLFEAGAAAEASVYGLRKHEQALGDLSMVYYRGGEAAGQTLVMVHGYTADKTVWPRFARHFMDEFDVIIPDLAGHGETAFRPDWNYSQQAQAERILALLDQLGIEKAHIIGNSMGGYISAYFALAFPERTLSTALMDPAGVISPVPSEMDQMLLSGRNPFAVHSLDEFHQFYPMTMAQPPYLPGFVQAAIGQSYIDRRADYTQIFQDISTEPRLTDRLAQIQAPALLIWGDQDRLIHVSATQVWAQGIDKLQVHIMPGLGHMPMVEAPAASAKIYRGFLAEQ